MKITAPVVKLLILFFLFLTTANAQKLPKIQLASLRAPADIKIDGKATEWNNVFQAYNPINRIFYTVSNDDNNLYLIAQMGDSYANEKVIFGITFTIKVPMEKAVGKSTGNITVIFPQPINPRKEDAFRNRTTAARRLMNDTTNAGRGKIDSLSIAGNKQIDNLFKEIVVAGIKDISEPSISIYNSEGIKAVAQFNSHMQYVYELAIPLKYLGIAINNGQKFKYNIKMNGRPAVSSTGIPTPTIEMPPNPSPSGMDNTFVDYATDFWGEYTLAKK